MVSPTVMRGLSEPYGSWKTICARRRSRRSSERSRSEPSTAPSRQTALPRPASPIARAALANIYRPGALTPSVVKPEETQEP